MFVTTATTLLALIVVGVFAADEHLTTPQSRAPLTFTTLCSLKVVSDTENWDLSFLRGNEELIMLGIHPEGIGAWNLAVRNDVFRRGTEMWGMQWLDGSFPSGHGQSTWEYTFEFRANELVMLCEGNPVVSIPYDELTRHPKELFLNDIDTVMFVPGSSGQNLKFAQTCSTGKSEVKPSPKLIMYDNANQAGRAITLTGPTANFKDIGWNDLADSVWALNGGWELYTRTGYEGDRFFVEEGQKLNAKDRNHYSSGRPANCRYVSDPTTAKLRVSTSSHLQYEYGVKMAEYLTPQEDLGDMDDKITSLIADKGDWEMYQYTGYQGKRLVIKEGEKVEHLNSKGFNDDISSLRPICETYKGKGKCALERIEVLDKEGDLEPKYTGTEIIGSQSSGSCYGPAEHEIEITQTDAVEESVSIEISKEDEVNWDVTASASVEVSVGFMGTGSSFSAGLSVGAGGAVTFGSSKTTESTTINEKEHGQITKFNVPGAGIVFGIVDRYEIDQGDIPVKMHMICPDGNTKTVDSTIAMKQVSFGSAHFWSLTGEFTKEACNADRSLPDCVANVRKNFSNFIGQKTEIEDAFEACFAGGKGEFRRMKLVRV